MQLNTILLAALAGITLAAPAPAPAADKCPKLPTPAQAKRIKVQESVGLSCSVSTQCTFYCTDFQGGDCFLDINGGGSCVF
ncbi:hypothetical protein GGTG_10560 [Gaeumannomyces tritici R3-111a-1]|uniref:Uncharacterized protein n=1 Tax=Gaeumannomyces tritici (strain R3-111a-1) TaxID=644352 RepID=J3PAN5_GAET3|nr:hypothetical protein GGTG_10560 [Gaeumannomyces tritici R3-111a-1]EJT71301.1 hypothetical protein GGTG_10560 [Gaeumannomyces tritici R3-111a-1]